jgi:hypothetical protein
MCVLRDLEKETYAYIKTDRNIFEDTEKENATERRERHTDIYTYCERQEGEKERQKLREIGKRWEIRREREREKERQTDKKKSM